MKLQSVVTHSSHVNLSERGKAWATLILIHLIQVQALTHPPGILRLNPLQYHHLAFVATLELRLDLHPSPEFYVVQV
jgi:hypothetical protein